MFSLPHMFRPFPGRIDCRRGWRPKRTLRQLQVTAALNDNWRGFGIELTGQEERSGKNKSGRRKAGSTAACTDTDESQHLGGQNEEEDRLVPS